MHFRQRTFVVILAILPDFFNCDRTICRRSILHNKDTGRIRRKILSGFRIRNGDITHIDFDDISAFVKKITDIVCSVRAFYCRGLCFLQNIGSVFQREYSVFYRKLHETIRITDPCIIYSGARIGRTCKRIFRSFEMRICDSVCLTKRKSGKTLFVIDSLTFKVAPDALALPCRASVFRYCGETNLSVFIAYCLILRIRNYNISFYRCLLDYIGSKLNICEFYRTVLTVSIF